MFWCSFEFQKWNDESWKTFPCTTVESTKVPLNIYRNCTRRMWILNWVDQVALLTAPKIFYDERIRPKIYLHWTNLALPRATWDSSIKESEWDSPGDSTNHKLLIFTEILVRRLCSWKRFRNRAKSIGGIQAGHG